MPDPPMLFDQSTKRLAIIAGGLVLLAIYYYVGKRHVGPDDNFWGPLRRTLLPRLDAMLAEYGGYAENRAGPAEFVGVVHAPPEAVERSLYEAGYRWNFAAGLKSDPEGHREYSSWAKRHLTRPRLRQLLNALEGLPLFGISVELLEAGLARRQVHPSLFALEDGSTAVYAHEEPNALNPVMFIAHYRGGRGPGARDLLGTPVEPLDVEAGVRAVANDLLDQSAPVDLSPDAHVLVEARRT